MAEDSRIKSGPGSKGYKWTDEQRKRFSETKRQSYIAGRSKPYGTAKKEWFFSPSQEKWVYLKSSWEMVFAKYCEAAGIAWQYEALIFVDETGKSWHPDFLVDGTIYDPGWRDKTKLVEVCEANGYTCHPVGKDQIDLMRSFL